MTSTLNSHAPLSPTFDTDDSLTTPQDFPRPADDSMPMRSAPGPDFGTLPL